MAGLALGLVLGFAAVGVALLASRTDMATTWRALGVLLHRPPRPPLPPYEPLTAEELHAQVWEDVGDCMREAMGQRPIRTLGELHAHQRRLKAIARRRALANLGRRFR